MSIDLPFNATIINHLYSPLPPDHLCINLPGFWVVLQGTSLVLSRDNDQQLLFGASLPDRIIPETEPIVIGTWQGKPLRALRVKIMEQLPDEYDAFPFQGGDVRLDNALATIAGRAAQIMHWERRSRFCSHCGTPTVRIPGGWGKSCQSCGDEHFPHIHPCIIVMVRRGNELLLIRNSSWSAGRFSLIAGFLDFGESLEECVKREVREEAGIEVTNIRYVGSQCWPFPSQQMIGFLADYASGDIKPDGAEIVEAGWFKNGSLPSSPGGKRSISRWIIDTFGRSL